MASLRDLHRYLSLEAFVRSRRAARKGRPHELTAAEVEIEGRTVTVVEDDNGVCELSEQRSLP